VGASVECLGRLAASPSIQPIALILEKKIKKNLDFRVPVWIKNSTRIRTEPIILSVRVSEPKKFNISVRTLENSVRISGFRFEFSVTDIFEHLYNGGMRDHELPCISPPMAGPTSKEYTVIKKYPTLLELSKLSCEYCVLLPIN